MQFEQHLNLTLEMLMRAIYIGDSFGSEWLLDVLQKLIKVGGYIHMSLLVVQLGKVVLEVVAKVAVTVVTAYLTDLVIEKTSSKKTK